MLDGFAWGGEHLRQNEIDGNALGQQMAAVFWREPFDEVVSDGVQRVFAQLVGGKVKKTG